MNFMHVIYTLRHTSVLSNKEDQNRSCDDDSNNYCQGHNYNKDKTILAVTCSMQVNIMQ